jgi:hypothetical protein
MYIGLEKVMCRLVLSINVYIQGMNAIGYFEFAA